MYIAIIMLPMLSAISAGLGGRYIGEKGAKVLTTIMITVASVISWVYLIKYASGLGQIVEIKLWTWVETGRGCKKGKGGKRVQKILRKKKKKE